MKTDVPPRFCLICLISLAFIFLVIVPSSFYSTQYAAEFSEQITQGLKLAFKIHQTATFQLTCKHTGTLYWNKLRNAADPHSIELRSVDGATYSNRIDSPLYPGNGPQPLWANRQSVVGSEEVRGDPNQIATFPFTVTMTSNSGNYRVFFQPCIYGNFIGTGRFFDQKFATPSISSPSLFTSLADGLAIQLNWQNNSSDSEDFEIEMKGASSSYSLFRGLSSSSKSLSDTDVLSNWMYCYRIGAYNGSNISTWLEYYAQVLAVRVNFRAAVKSQSKIDLSVQTTLSWKQDLS